jgi:hypothetical protein
MHIFLKLPVIIPLQFQVVTLCITEASVRLYFQKKLPLLAESFILQRISDGRITGLQLVEILLMLCFQ